MFNIYVEEITAIQI